MFVKLSKQGRCPPTISKVVKFGLDGSTRLLVTYAGSLASENQRPPRSFEPLSNTLTTELISFLVSSKIYTLCILILQD